jgi:hypothetical protein
MPAKTCFARTLGAPEPAPWASETIYRGAECGAEAARTITVDDGDASFGICPACFKRFLTKGTKNDQWYGWFDCAVPAHAPVKGSKWYQDLVAAAHAALAVATEESVSEAEEKQSESEEELASPDAPPVLPTPAKSAREQIEEQLAALAARAAPLRATGKTTPELLAINRQIFALKKQLMLLA